MMKGITIISIKNNPQDEIIGNYIALIIVKKKVGGKMRELLIISLIFFSFSFVMAETLKINLNNGEIVEFDTSEINEITFEADVSIEEIVEFVSKIPIKFLKNSPNPFNPTTNISFEIGESGKTKIDIFNVKGQKIKTLLNERMEVGKHSVVWNGKDDKNKRVSSGVYFYKVSINGNQKLNKMIMLK